MERVKQRQKEETSIDEDIPTAPTIEDFYYDPGIRERLAPSISGATDVPSLGQEVTESLSKMDLKGTSYSQLWRGCFSPQVPVHSALYLTIQ